MAGPARSVDWRRYAEVLALLASAAAAAWVVLGGSSLAPLASVDLGFHEVGHLVFDLIPGMVTAVAGTTVQVAVPLGLALYFGLRREAYASSLMLAWAATSAANVSAYIADAPFRMLPLLGNGSHDWSYILAAHMGWAAPLAAGVRWGAVGLAVIGVIVAALPLLAPRLRAGREAESRRERDVREAQLAAVAPRREPRNAPARLPGRSPNEQRPPSAPAARF
jgi:hypothetical protein